MSFKSRFSLLQLYLCPKIKGMSLDTFKVLSKSAEINQDNTGTPMNSQNHKSQTQWYIYYSSL